MTDRENPTSPLVLAYQNPRLSDSADTKDSAHSALMSSILALLLFWIPVVTMVLVALSIAAGLNARRRASSAGTRRVATAGIVLAVVAGTLNAGLSILLLVIPGLQFVL